MKVGDILNNDEAKQLYFKYCCNLSSMCRDIELADKENILKLIDLNELKWTKEFQIILQEEMKTSKKIFNFCSSYAKYLLSCKSFDDYFDLACILFNTIFTNQFFFEGLFVYFYEIIYCTDTVTLNKKTINNSLFDYYRLNNEKRKYELIKMTKEVLLKDKFMSSRYKEVEMLLK